jgi:hypothetical protein
MKRLLPGLAIVAVLTITALVLRFEGRLWWCSCEYLLLWSGDPWSSDNSQHLSDPYSFTHVLHGFLFAALLAPAAAWMTRWWLLVVAICVEGLWEIVENSEYVIGRYREQTAALGYQGDTVVNSISDIVLCGIGFVVARRLGWWRALILFVVTEVALAVWIRDNLTLNILMLIYPVDAIREWQAAGH